MIRDVIFDETFFYFYNKKSTHRYHLYLDAEQPLFVLYRVYVSNIIF